MIRFVASLLKGHPVRSSVIVIGVLGGAFVLLSWFHPDRSNFNLKAPAEKVFAENSVDRSSETRPSLRKTVATTTGEESGLPEGEGVNTPAFQKETEKEPYSPDLDAADAFQTQIEQTITLFEDRVLSHTSATWVRLETKFQPDAGPAANEKLPGYVAFATSAEAYYPDGIALTMEDIAAEYFTQFPKAPIVRVSLVVGGRVQGGRTFKPDDIY